MKTKAELDALKEEAEALNSKLAELSEDELAQVAGGRIVRDPEEISGAGSGSSGHLVLDDSDPLTRKSCIFHPPTTVWRTRETSTGVSEYEK